MAQTTEPHSSEGQKFKISITGLKSRCWQVPPSSKGSGGVGNPFLTSASFWWLCSHSVPCSQITPISACLPITFSDIGVKSSNLSLRTMLKIVCRSHLDIQRSLPILAYLITPAKSAIKVPFANSRE